MGTSLGIRFIHRLVSLMGGVKIILWLTWVTFAVGTRWLALGVGCRARRREEKAEVGRRRRGEEAGDETGTERNSTSDWGAIQLPSYVHGYILYTTGLEAPMWYVQGGTVAVRTVGLGTRNSELGTRSSSR